MRWPATQEDDSTTCQYEADVTLYCINGRTGATGYSGTPCLTACSGYSFSCRLSFILGDCCCCCGGCSMQWRGGRAGGAVTWWNSGFSLRQSGNTAVDEGGDLLDTVSDATNKWRHGAQAIRRRWLGPGATSASRDGGAAHAVTVAKGSTVEGLKACLLLFKRGVADGQRRGLCRSRP